MLKLTAKKRIEYRLGPGQAFGITLRRPNYGEGPAILTAVLESLQPILAQKPTPVTLPENPTSRDVLMAGIPSTLAQARAMTEAAKAIPKDLVSRLFSEYVESVDGIEDVTTGEQLLAIADLSLVRYVLEALASICRLTVDEGKASASPSTSDTAPAAESSPSPAPSTEREAGTEPSTATETPAT